MAFFGKVDHGRPWHSQLQPGTARYSAKKAHIVLCFRKSGASEILNMILRGHHLWTTWGLVDHHKTITSAVEIISHATCISDGVHTGHKHVYDHNLHKPGTVIVMVIVIVI